MCLQNLSSLIWCSAGLKIPAIFVGLLKHLINHLNRHAGEFFEQDDARLYIVLHCCQSAINSWRRLTGIWRKQNSQNAEPLLFTCWWFTSIIFHPLQGDFKQWNGRLHYKKHPPTIPYSIPGQLLPRQKSEWPCLLNGQNPHVRQRNSNTLRNRGRERGRAKGDPA